MKDYFDNTNSLYKVQFGKKVSGVCAGLARYWNTEVWIIRAVALISLLLFPVPTAIAYLLAVILLPSR
ncbi:PspC domain-containing protein [Neptunicella sp. SCSIO 80796]|uniref:PspC domain-containing protein n=1 Tax=Neptunicella plasticusilytica TaxID=3117012 RepID=UPI003A4D36A4